jgi:5-methylcytosine-specific restriction endonuclease McrA
MVVLNTGKAHYKCVTSYKVCVTCKETKNRTEFWQRATGVWAPNCKPCGLALQNDRYKASPSFRAAMTRRSRTWAKNNPDRRTEICRTYERNNKDKVKASKKAWLSANKDAANVFTNKRRAKLRGNAGSYTVQEWISLKADYDYTCLRCGKQEPEIKLTVDHVLPVSLGGPNYISNIQPLCGPCNSSKCDQHIDYRPTWARETSHANIHDELQFNEA